MHALSVTLRMVAQSNIGLLNFLSKQQSKTLFFFDQVSYIFKKINKVSLLAGFFLLCVVFDVQSFSTKGFSTRSCASVWNTNYITALFMIIYDIKYNKY